MANEAVMIVKPTKDARRYTCNSSVAIAKGALLSLVDAVTVSGAVLPGYPVAGIAASEKTAADGTTSIGCYTDGTFDLKASGVITAGELVQISGANLISHVETLDRVLSGCVLGKALETASDAEVIAVAVGVIV